jgi:transcriptional regulator with XRE-family HTH domain
VPEVPAVGLGTAISKPNTEINKMAARTPSLFTADRIHNARTAAGLNIDEMSEAVYCPVTTLKLIEGGVVLPTLDLLESIAHACAVAVDTLYDPHDPHDPVVRFDRELTEMTDAMPPLTEGQRAILRPLLRVEG